MAAEAIASLVLEHLASLALNKLEEHFQLVMGAKDEVEKLTDSYEAIQALLYDAEIKKITDTNVNFWLQRFRDVAYEMDDILDHWITANLISQIGGNHTNDTNGASSSSSKNKKMVYSYFSSFCSCFGKVTLRHEIGLKIKELREKLDAIVREKDALSLISNLPASNAHPDGWQKPDTSIIDESENIGRADDQKIISSMLLDDSSSIPFIVSIVGMGGLGKTTLAQLAYKEARVANYFDKVIWVSVSYNFDEIRIAKEIIRGAGDPVPEYLSEWNDDLHSRLCKSVQNKRFLLVLDNMWTDDKNKWKPFKLAFKNAAQGSRVLVTTRNQSVADMIDSNYSHPLKGLSEENCWFLLSRLAFQGKNADKARNKAWIETGTKIAERCKGVPLYVKFLGNLLREKENIIEWQTVMDKESIWKLEKAEDDILKPALLLSYYDLPPSVRACFVYCTIFPKGHQIHKDELISLWMAQGLIPSTGGSEGEAVGNMCFNSLAARSFFQNFKQDLEGNIIHCDMHDLVHDFAEFVTNREYLTLTDTSSYLQSPNPRHLTLFSENSFNPDSFPSSIFHGKKNLKTFLVLNRSYSPLQLKTMLADVLHRLRYLRVLILNIGDLECLPAEIKKLIHLRYLNLSGNSHLTELPDSLCNLYNLQTLDVSHCSRLRKLPEELGRLVKLRRLLFEGTVLLQFLPQGVGTLTSLRTLTKFIVGVLGGCNIKQLKDLNQLEGELIISGLGRVQSWEDALLKGKKNLCSLLLNFDFEEDSNLGVFIDTPGFFMPTCELLDEVPETEVHHVFAALEPPTMLGKLKINKYRGSKFSNWIASDQILSNLCNLELDYCQCMELPALGRLPLLKHLSIFHMHKLEHIGTEFYGVDEGGHGSRVAFPQLKTLRISEASGLVDFIILRSSRGVEVMPLLHEVEIHNCVKLKALPAFGKLPSLEHLNISSLHNVKHIGTEFYGNDGGCADSVAFPKLKKLRIEGAHILEEWDTSPTLGMPCLRELELCGFKCLRVLPDFGKLPWLQHLDIGGLHKLEHIEFHGDVGGDSVRVVFPSLEKLRIEGAHILEEWNAFAAPGAGAEVSSVMPCLDELELSNCGLKALPALGKLLSLKKVRLICLDKLEHIRSEFYGAGGGKNTDNVAFPKLETLEISFAKVLEEWILNVEEHSNLVINMPRLRRVNISWCGALKKLPALGKLQSLEILDVRHMNSLKEIGNEFYGISGGSTGGNHFVSFPKLLSFRMEVKLERWGLGTDAEEDIGQDGAVYMIMPRVHHIHIEGLELRTLPALGKLPSLRTLTLSDLKNVTHIGPEFYGLRRNRLSTEVFPKLCELHLVGMRNLQRWEPKSTESSICIMPCLRELKITHCSILRSLPQHLSDTLRSLYWDFSALTTPPALGQLEVLQDLDIFMCAWWHMPTEIQGMRCLRTLNVGLSASLEENSTSVDWSIIKHIPNIRIGDRTICGHF